MEYLRKPLDVMTNKVFAAARELKLKESKSRDEENVVICPFAVTAVAALLYYASEGEPSHRQLETLLRFGSLFEGHSETKSVLMAFRAAIKTLTKHRAVSDDNADFDSPDDAAAQFFQLIMATKIFVQKDVDIQTEFANLINRNLNIEIEKLELDFGESDEETPIETWLKEKIESNFDVSLPEGLIDAQFHGPRAVIASTAHYRAGWETPFERSRSFWGPFRLDNGKTKQVHYMNIRATIPFSQDEHSGIRMVEIPFYQNTASLVVTLPTKKSTTMQQLMTTDVNWKTMHMQRRMKLVDVTLPKFFMECTFDIKSLFNSIGIKDIFLNDHGLNQMTQGGLKINEGFHKCAMQLDEDGTFAYKSIQYRDKHGMPSPAAEGQPVSPLIRKFSELMTWPSPTKTKEPVSGPVAEEFKADSPFLVAIRHNKSHLFCFAGCVVNP